MFENPAIDITVLLSLLVFLNKVNDVSFEELLHFKSIWFVEAIFIEIIVGVSGGGGWWWWVAADYDGAEADIAE